MKKTTRATKPKLKDAKPEEYFILVTGTPLKNVKELLSSFEHMNEWVFRHHVNDARNDFASWIREVLEDKQLADEIQDIKDMKAMEIKAYRYLLNKYL